jgi:ABC-type lipoprotein release transport system permease subunit
MELLKLAFRNIIRAGLRTWLNVFAVSLAIVAMVLVQGTIRGMIHQLESANIDAQYGGGQYWHVAYEPFDFLSLDDAHGPVPAPLQQLIAQQNATTILMRQGTLYPKGRMQAVVIRGIAVEQQILSIPSHLLVDGNGYIPAVIGARMAKSAGLAKGDLVTLRWRDANGTYDARDVRIVEIMRTPVQEIDVGQIWVPLEQLRKLTGLPGEGTIIVLAKDLSFSEHFPGWEYKDLDYLLKDVRAAMEVEAAGDSLFYLVLLALAMLAIFDTQLLSLFKRRKEMGTLMALGLTRAELMGLFTLEGSLYALLASLTAALYGTPLMVYLARHGISMSGASDSFGLALGDVLYPIFSPGLVLGTLALIFLITTLVSYWPTRRIARMNPTDALRGRNF